MIEHSNMRYNQAFDVEHLFSEQVVKVAFLISDFLIDLANAKFNVEYAGFAGNHDRITDKDKNLDGDHIMKMVNPFVQSLVCKFSNITYVQAEDYSHSIEVYDKHIKFIHGDLDSINDKLLAIHSSDDNIAYSAIVVGHWHKFLVMEVGFNKHIFGFGSLKGVDLFSKRIRKQSSASQGFLTIYENDDTIYATKVVL